MRILPVTSLDLPELELFRSLRENTRHWGRGCFVAEGGKVVRQLIASEIEIVSMLMTPEWLAVLGDALDARGDFPVYLAGAELLDSITGFVMHQRVMAIGRVPANEPGEVFGGLRGVTTPPLVVALEGIADAENMGMIVRTCAGLGAAALVTGPDSCSPWLRRSVRVSMGSIFTLPVCRVDALVPFLADRRDRDGWRIVGTSPRGGAPDMVTATSTAHGRGETAAPVCLVFGSEGYGLSAEALGACTDLWSVPMHRGVDSLNVAHAVAIGVYAFGGQFFDR